MMEDDAMVLVTGRFRGGAGGEPTARDMEEVLKGVADQVKVREGVSRIQVESVSCGADKKNQASKKGKKAKIEPSFRFTAKARGLSKELVQATLQIDQKNSICVCQNSFVFDEIRFRVLKIDCNKQAERRNKRDNTEPRSRQVDVVNAFQIKGDCVRLKKMQLVDSDVTDIVLKELKKAITCHRTISKIDLSGNLLTNAGAQAILEFLKSHPKDTENVRELDLSRNSEIENTTLEEIAGVVAVSTLKYLSNGDNHADALRSLNERGLGDAGAVAVANFLSGSKDKGDSKQLPVLGLAKNSVGRAGACALAQAMLTDSPLVRSVKLLEVYSNAGGDFWAVSFAPVIRTNRSLTSLDLGSNEIGDRGAAEIACALRGSALGELHLDYNCISRLGAQALSDSVPSSQLHTLWLHGNPIGEPFSTSHLAATVFANRLRLIPRPAKEEIASQLAARAMEMQSVLEEAFRNEAARAERSVCADIDPDQMASLSLQCYERLMPGHAQDIRGQAVIACFLVQFGSTVLPVSLGIGTRFVDTLLLGGPDERERVKDSHAEIVARRGLLRFLHAQLYLLRENKSSLIFSQAPGKTAYSLSPHVRFHLYTSTAPCGAASSRSLDPKVISGKGGGRTCSPSWQPGFRKSCTDKIARWNTQGLQGKRLGDKVGVIPLNSIVIGRRWSDRCSLCLPNSAPTKILLEPNISNQQTLRGDSDNCVVWTLGDESPHMYDGKTGLRINTCPAPISPWWLQQEVAILWPGLHWQI